MTDDTPIDHELNALFEKLPPPRPRPGFYDRSLACALRERERGRQLRRSRLRWMLAGAGSAVAAGIVAVVVAGLLFDAELPHADDAVASVHMTLDEPRTVSLVFAAGEPLENAQLTLTLPDGIEVDGFPGRRELSWETTLAAGRNRLPLTLVAVDGPGGEIVARLEHAARGRTFRLHVDVG